MPRISILAHQHRRAEADGEGENVEVPDEAGGVEDGLTRLLGVGHGIEAHEDMRQTRGAEHERQPQGDGVEGIADQAARLHESGPVLFDGGAEEGVIVEMEFGQHHDHQDGGAAQEQHRLDDLHPGGRQHAAEKHVGDHERAHGRNRQFIRQPEQQFDQGARAHHLRDQVEQDGDDGAQGRRRAHRARA